jgi:hypothetical protein
MEDRKQRGRKGLRTRYKLQRHSSLFPPERPYLLKFPPLSKFHQQLGTKPSKHESVGHISDSSHNRL